MIKRLFVILIAAILAFAVYVALLPGQYSVDRSATIAAPPEAVFTHVNNFKKWDDWSPWAKRDPNSKTAYEGPQEGPGAIFKWDGNEEVGKGQMTIIESTPAERIAIKLEFERPFPGSSNVGFAFKPEGEGTKVTWSLAGEQGFVERAMMLVMGLDMDEMIGKEYETGLASLKRIVESEQTPAESDQGQSPSPSPSPSPSGAESPQ
jgi:uncharacterized protein YndB with AHSA1/START domain